MNVMQTSTVNPKTYWNSKGKYEKESKELSEKLVPAMGRAKTMHGNLLRCMNNLYYDLYNNGMCNAANHLSDAMFLEQFDEDIEKKLGKDKGYLARLIEFVKNVAQGDEDDDDYLAGLDQDEVDDMFMIFERVTDAVIEVVIDEEKSDKKREALVALKSAFALATSSGLFDCIQPFCKNPESINDVANAYEEFEGKAV
jgi:hypothetical protein